MTEDQIDQSLLPNPPCDRLSTIFNGTYTVTSPSGEHRTFLIHTQPDNARFAAGQRTIALLTGGDNNDPHCYKGFGFVTDNGIHVWKGKRRGDGTKSNWEKFAALVWSLATNGERSFFYEKGCRLLLEGRCLHCNRKLTHPTSIITGIGPECAKRR